MYKSFNKHVRNFLTSTGISTINKGEYYYGLQDPTYLGFDINFVFYPDHMLDDPAPYLKKVGLLYPEEYRDSAISYLYRVGRLKEKEMLKEFRNQLMFVVNEMPWYFQSVTGLDRYFRSFYNVEESKFKDAYEYGDFKIEINCLETYDRRMSYMFDLLHASCIDSKWERYIIPHNLAGFITFFHLYEIRNVSNIISTFRDIYRINESNVTENEIKEAGSSVLNLLENNFYFHIISINTMFDFDYSVYNTISNDKIDEMLKFKFYLHRVGTYSVKNYYGFFKWFISSFDTLNKFYSIKDDDTYKLLYQDKYFNINNIDSVLSERDVLKTTENMVESSDVSDVTTTEEEKEASFENDKGDTLVGKLFKWGKELVDRRAREELKKIAPKEVKKVIDIIDQAEFKSKIYLNQFNFAFNLVKGTIEDINKKGISGPLDIILYGKNIYEGLKGLKNLSESILKELGIIRRNQSLPKRFDSRSNVYEDNLNEKESDSSGIGEPPVKKAKEASDRINKKEEEVEKRNYIGVIDFSNSPSLRTLKTFIYNIELIYPSVVTVITPIEFTYVSPLTDINPIELYKPSIVTEISPIDFIKPSVVDTITSINLIKPSIVDSITIFDLKKSSIVDTITGFDLIVPDILKDITGFELLKPSIVDSITGFDLIVPSILDNITRFELLRPDILDKITSFNLSKPSIKENIDRFNLLKPNIVKDIVKIEFKKSDIIKNISEIEFKKSNIVTSISSIDFKFPDVSTTIVPISFGKFSIIDKITNIDFIKPSVIRNISDIRMQVVRLDKNISNIKFSKPDSSIKISKINFEKYLSSKRIGLGNVFKVDKLSIKRLSNIKFSKINLKRNIFYNLVSSYKKENKISFIKLDTNRKNLNIRPIEFKLEKRNIEISKILVDKKEVIKTINKIHLKKPVVETNIKKIDLKVPSVEKNIVQIRLVRPSIVKEIVDIKFKKYEDTKRILPIKFEKIKNLEKNLVNIKIEKKEKIDKVTKIDLQQDKIGKNVTGINFIEKRKEKSINDIKFLTHMNQYKIRERNVFLSKKKEKERIMENSIINKNVFKYRSLNVINFEKIDSQKIIENIKLIKPSVKTSFIELKLKSASKKEVTKFDNVYKINFIVLKNLIDLKESGLKDKNIFKNLKKENKSNKIEIVNIFRELKKKKING